jgi:hypothetical protein
MHSKISEAFNSSMLKQRGSLRVRTSFVANVPEVPRSIRSSPLNSTKHEWNTFLPTGQLATMCMDEVVLSNGTLLRAKCRRQKQRFNKLTATWRCAMHDLFKSGLKPCWALYQPLPPPLSSPSIETMSFIKPVAPKLGPFRNVVLRQQLRNPVQRLFWYSHALLSDK